MSTESQHTFERRFTNSLPALTRATEDAVGFLEANGISSKAVYAANLTIEEMGTNILKFSYDDAAVHEILLRLELQSERLLLIIEDDGQEFNPLDAPEPDIHLPPVQRTPGGLGIHLVRHFAEEVGYERRDGRNRLTISIRA